MKMKQQPPAVTWFSLLFIVLLSLATSNIAQEVEDEREFSYIRGSENGPEKWGNIKPEWALRNTGRFQSPINLLRLRVEELPNSQKIITSYRPGPTVLKNRGHDIQLEWQDERSKIQINGTDYILRNVHWHSPSEHTINGFRYALELHMVHESADNRVAVIGLVYIIGPSDPFLAMLSEEIASISDSRREVDAGIIDPAEVKMRGSSYYRYMGSLTTPPCSENVIWTVYQQAGTVSLQQIAMLRKAVDDDAMQNARPLQPLNGRNVHLYFKGNNCGEKLFRKSLIFFLNLLKY